jgi:hypothetical protein
MKYTSKGVKEVCYKYYAMKMYKGMEVQLLSTGWWCMVSFTHWALYPRERAPHPSTCWTGGWMGPRASVNAVAKRRNLFFAPSGTQSPFVQPNA